MLPKALTDDRGEILVSPSDRAKAGLWLMALVVGVIVAVALVCAIGHFVDPFAALIAAMVALGLVGAWVERR